MPLLEVFEFDALTLFICITGSKPVYLLQSSVNSRLFFFACSYMSVPGYGVSMENSA